MPIGITLSDIYGGAATTAETTPAVQEMSGGEGSPAPGVTVSWFGIVLMLIILRVLYELAEET
jgi:hypothetical protein